MQGMTKTEGVEIGEDGQHYRIFSVWREKSSAGEFMLRPAPQDARQDAAIALTYVGAVKALQLISPHSH
jgi:hypothetical protein